MTCLAEERDGIPQAMQVTEVEGYAPIYAERKKFGELPAAYPNEQIVLRKRILRYISRWMRSVRSATASAFSRWRRAKRASLRF